MKILSKIVTLYQELDTLKADSYIACRAHAIPLP